MTTNSVSVPFPIFTDIDGNPLELGNIYIGQPNLDPQTSPKNAYWDAAMTLQASQPIQTRGGYPVRSGTPARIYVDGDYSIKVNNRNGTLIYSAPTRTEQLDSAVVNYTPAGTGAVATTVEAHLRSNLKSITDFGALGNGANESAAANAMIAASNYLYVPVGFTLVCKNIQLFNGTKVICDGELKLPSNCSDFDRLIYAAGKSNIRIEIKEINGNASAQSGSIGTHLVYLTNCQSPEIDIRYVHDHYIASGSPEASVDGIRDSSTGAVFLYQCDGATVNIGLLQGWGREGIQLRVCTNSEVTLGHAQGIGLTEYSGLQVSGSHNKINRASVDYAGASAVGFDTTYGIVSNIISTNTRANSGLNFGHPGYPATGSIASNIVVDRCYGFGIGIQASSQDVLIDNFSIKNAGGFGVSASDGVLRAKLTNGVVANSGRANINTSVAEIRAVNVRSSDLDDACLYTSGVIGSFVEGETVTTTTGSATARAVVKNLDGSSQIIFLTSVSGTFTATQAITGSTSGATGTISTAYSPAKYSELGGGVVAEDVSYYPGSTMDQVRLPDGTAFMNLGMAFSGTANTLVKQTANFTSNVRWVSSPAVVASIASYSSTSGFNTSILIATATTSKVDVSIKTDQTQTYGVNVLAIGRWK